MGLFLELRAEERKLEDLEKNLLSIEEKSSDLHNENMELLRSLQAINGIQRGLEREIEALKEKIRENKVKLEGLLEKEAGNEGLERKYEGDLEKIKLKIRIFSENKGKNKDKIEKNPSGNIENINEFVQELAERKKELVILEEKLLNLGKKQAESEFLQEDEEKSGYFVSENEGLDRNLSQIKEKIKEIDLEISKQTKEISDLENENNKISSLEAQSKQDLEEKENAIELKKAKRAQLIAQKEDYIRKKVKKS